MKQLISLLFYGPLNLIALASGTITTNDRDVLYLDQLSIEKNGHLTFDQQDTTSSILVIVNKRNNVKIEGTLSSNGSVHLVAPGGIHISHTGVIHTSGFTASTLRISTEAFRESPHGPWLYSGSSEMPIVQQGHIGTTHYALRLVSCFVDQIGVIDSCGPTQITSLLDQSHLPNTTRDAWLDFQTDE